MRLLKNANVYMTDGKFLKIDLLIENGIITKMGEDLNENCETVDLTDKYILPGFINTHVHLSQQLARGLADDVDLLTWLEKRIWPYEASLSEQEAYDGAMACIAEMVKTGVTSFLEAGGQHVEQMAKAVKDSGIRAALCKSTMDVGNCPTELLKTTEQELRVQEDLIKTYHNTCEGRLRIFLGLRTIFSNTTELIIKTKQLADKYKTGIHMHVAEIEQENIFCKEQHDLGTVKYLDRLNVLDQNLLAAHTVWLDDEDIALFAKKGVKVSHNPGAAMKVVLGFAPIPQMLSKGIPVSIGTDGAPSNNQMNIMRDMYLASLIFKGKTLDPTTMPASTILTMVTQNGAKCSLLEDQIGKIEIGYQADLVVIDFNYLHSMPVYEPIEQIVYACDRENVFATMVAGEFLYYDKELLFVDESQLLESTKRHMEAIRTRIF